MKQLMIIIGAMLSIFFQSCNSQNKEPVRMDILGIWKSPEKAEIIFNNDGTFTGTLIPAEFGFFPPDSFRNVKFNGSGKWSLRKTNTNWEVYLDFDKVSVNKNGCAFPLLIANEKKKSESESSWYLFVWKEEEGGERYKFLKE